MENKILNSRQVMDMLGICENTLLSLESKGDIIVDFRIGNRKRYHATNVLSSLEKKHKTRRP